MALAEFFEARDAVAEEVVLEAEVRIVADDEADGRRNLLVDLGDDDARAEATQYGVEHKVVVAVYVEAQHAEVVRDAVLAQERDDVRRRGECVRGVDFEKTSVGA